MAEQESSASRGAPWGLRDMLHAGLMTVALMMLAIVGIAAYMWLTESWSSDGGPPDVPVSAIFALEALLIVPAWWFGPRKYGGGVTRLGLRRFRAGKAALVVAVGLGLILGINALWELIRAQLGWARQPDFLPLFGEGFGGLVLALVLGGVVAPFAEEIAFRGYLYPGLQARVGRGWGMVLSSLLFGVLHFTPGVVLPIFAMGLIFALVYDLSDSIWPCIALHGIMNSLAFVMLYLAENYPAIVPGG